MSIRGVHAPWSSPLFLSSITVLNPASWSSDFTCRARSGAPGAGYCSWWKSHNRISHLKIPSQHLNKYTSHKFNRFKNMKWLKLNRSIAGHHKHSQRQPIAMPFWSSTKLHRANSFKPSGICPLSYLVKLWREVVEVMNGGVFAHYIHRRLLSVPMCWNCKDRFWPDWHIIITIL